MFLPHGEREVSLSASLCPGYIGETLKDMGYLAIERGGAARHRLPAESINLGL